MSDNNLHWFPGHMMRAVKVIDNLLPVIDLAVEIRDARAINATYCTLLDKLLKDKLRLIILNKSDLADTIITKKWISYFATQGIQVIELNSLHNLNPGSITKIITKVLDTKIKKQQAKGIKAPKMKILVMGVPNVGKSTFINGIAKRKATKVGNKPGVTKGEQWIKISDTIDLLDSPGVLPPQLNNPEVNMHLGLINAIPYKESQEEEIATYGIKFLQANYPWLLEKKYHISQAHLSDMEIDSGVLFTEIAKRYNYKMKNDQWDLSRAHNSFLGDLQSAKIGNISLELPPV